MILEHAIAGFEHGLWIGAVGDSQVTGEYVTAAGQGPGVHVMSIFHAVKRYQCFRHLGQSNLGGRTLHQQMGGIAQDTPARPQQYEAEGHAKQRVDQLARLLGEATGVDSVDCAVSGEKEATAVRDAKAEAAERARKWNLVATVGGKEVTHAQAKERETKIAYRVGAEEKQEEGAGGGTALRHVIYKWRWKE